MISLLWVWLKNHFFIFFSGFFYVQNQWHYSQEEKLFCLKSVFKTFVLSFFCLLPQNSFDVDWNRQTIFHSNDFLELYLNIFFPWIHDTFWVMRICLYSFHGYDILDDYHYVICWTYLKKEKEKSFFLVKSAIIKVV